VPFGDVGAWKTEITYCFPGPAFPAQRCFPPFVQDSERNAVPVPASSVTSLTAECGGASGRLVAHHRLQRLQAQCAYRTARYVLGQPLNIDHKTNLL